MWLESRNFWPHPSTAGKEWAGDLVIKTLEPHRTSGWWTHWCWVACPRGCPGSAPPLYYLVLWISRCNKPLMDSKVSFQQTMKPDEGVLDNPMCSQPVRMQTGQNWGLASKVKRHSLDWAPPDWEGEGGGRGGGCHSQEWCENWMDSQAPSGHRRSRGGCIQLCATIRVSTHWSPETYAKEQKGEI